MKKIIANLSALLVCSLVLTATAIQKEGKLFGYELDQLSTKEESIETKGSEPPTISFGEKGILVINTTHIGEDIYGYGDIVPLKIYILNDKIIKIEPLDHTETPSFYKRASRLFAKWIGLDTATARKLKVDVVTGATYTSNAIIDNVHIALDYLNKHSKDIQQAKKKALATKK